MNRQLLLAIDIGTTNSKGAVFTADGSIVASHSHRHRVSSPREGWAEHDAEAVWWAETVEICRKLTGEIDARDIKAVSISSLSPALVPMDSDGTALRPAMLYGLDRRATLEMAELKEEFGDYYKEHTDAEITPLSIGPKILWIKKNEPEIFEKAAYYGGVPTFLLLRLTGVAAADYGVYKIAGFPFSLELMDWNEDMMKACGVRRGQLPRLMFTVQTAGRVTAEAARLTGLAEGTPVTPGTSDFLSETISFGYRFRSMNQMTFGTTVGFDFGNDHGQILFTDYDSKKVKKGIRGAAMSNGCSTVDWIVSIISGYGRERLDDAVLGRMAAETAPGAKGITILPYLNGEKTPIEDPFAKGVIFGLNQSHTAADLYRAALESVAYSIRHLIEVNGKGHEVTEAVVMGGGTRIPGMIQTAADVTGCRLISLDSYSGSLVGDAFIAGMAAGIFKDRSEIDRWVRVSGSTEPRKEYSGIYDEGFSRYLELYGATKELMHVKGKALCTG